MNIFEYLSEKGINTADRTFYSKIDQWASWYRSNVRGFSVYRVYTGQGNFVKRQRKSLGMAKRLCEDIADLLMNERVTINVDDTRADEFLQRVFDENNFDVLMNEYQERKAYGGTAAYVPYIYDVEAADDEPISSGRIGINFVSASNIFPVSWNNGMVTECVFTFPRTVLRNKYIHLAHHKRDAEGLYIIENTVLECPSTGQWKELTPGEWQGISGFEGLAKIVETGSHEPQFVIDRLNIVNNADSDESNPMGVAIFANAIDVLKKIDIEYDSYSNEFELGRKRIFVAPEMLKNINGTPAFDTNEVVFNCLPDNYAQDGSGLIREVDMSIRTEQHSRAITDDLNMLSMKCGFGTEHYKFEASGVKTATEVISENSEMFRTLKKHELILRDVLENLVRIILRLGNVVGAGPFDEKAIEVHIDFDDSIIEDKASERTQDRQDVAMGAMPLWEYRKKWYHEDEATAKAVVVVDDGVIE